VSALFNAEKKAVAEKNTILWLKNSTDKFNNIFFCLFCTINMQQNNCIIKKDNCMVKGLIRGPLLYMATEK